MICVPQSWTFVPAARGSPLLRCERAPFQGGTTHGRLPRSPLPGDQPDVLVGKHLISRARCDTLWLSRVQTEISWSRSDSVQNGTSRRGDGPLDATEEDTARLPFHARCRASSQESASKRLPHPQWLSHSNLHHHPRASGWLPQTRSQNRMAMLPLTAGETVDNLYPQQRACCR